MAGRHESATRHVALTGTRPRALATAVPHAAANSSSTYDVIIIGGGIGGASVAAALGHRAARVLLIEGEAQPGYHSTGRSAALYCQTYGSPAMRALTVASHRHFLSLPGTPGFDAEVPLLTPRGVVHVARESEAAALREYRDECAVLTPGVRPLSPAEAHALCPALRQEEIAEAFYEEEAMDMDVGAIHQGMLSAAKHGGARVSSSTQLVSAVHDRDTGDWTVQLGGAGSAALGNNGCVRARTVINAAGAWADHVAVACGVSPIGLVPKVRTCIVFDDSGEHRFNAADPSVARWPFAMSVLGTEPVYFFPRAGTLVASPADETPAEPADVQPEELAIAICVDRLERLTHLSPRRISHKWAGLRSFVADQESVLGSDPAVPSFIWCSALGGYGIQAAPGVGLFVASAACGEDVPEELTRLGIAAQDVSPARLSAR